MNKFLYGLLASLLITLSGFGADITASATTLAVGTSPGSLPISASNTNLVGGPGFLYSITLTSSGFGAGTNVSVYLYDSENSTYSVSTTYSYILNTRSNVVSSWTDPYGVVRSRTFTGAIGSVKTNTTASLPKATLAILPYVPATQATLTYTFDPPLTFGRGLMLTNLLSGPANGSNALTATYTYSPAF